MLETQVKNEHFGHYELFVINENIEYPLDTGVYSKPSPIQV